MVIMMLVLMVMVMMMSMSMMVTMLLIRKEGGLKTSQQSPGRLDSERLFATGRDLIIIIGESCRILIFILGWNSKEYLGKKQIQMIQHTMDPD